MKLRFNVFGFDIAYVALDLEQQHHAADTVTDVVAVIEKRGAKLAGKVVDKFSSAWMRAWVSK